MNTIIYFPQIFRAAFEKLANFLAQAPGIIHISWISSFLPLVAVIRAGRPFTRGKQMLLLLCLIDMLCEMTALGYAFFREPNGWLIHVLTLSEFSLLMLIFSFWEANPNRRKYLRWSIPVFWAVWLLINLAVNESAPGQLNYSRAIAAIILALTAGYMLYRLAVNPLIVPSRDYRFWVALGALLYFGGNIFIFAQGFLANSPVQALVWQFHVGFNILRNLAFTAAMLCRSPREDRVETAAGAERLV